MRMRMNFDLSSSGIDIDFRPSLISFMKKSLQDKDKLLFEALYGNGEAVQKQFTFSAYLPNAIFEQEKIEIPHKKMAITFSCRDYGFFVRMYNSFLWQRFKPFPLKDNTLTLKSITLENECDIKQTPLTVNLVSPLVIRWHQREGNKDKYYTFSDEGFQDVLKVVVKNSIVDHEGLTASMVDDLTLDCVDCRVVVVRSFGGKIPATLGKLRLHANAKLLKYLYDVGLGSRRGEGYGMFTV